MGVDISLLYNFQYDLYFYMLAFSVIFSVKLCHPVGRNPISPLQKPSTATTDESDAHLMLRTNFAVETLLGGQAQSDERPGRPSFGGGPEAQLVTTTFVGNFKCACFGLAMGLVAGLELAMPTK